MNDAASCKICGSKNLSVFAHTAKCKDCGVLLCYPYPSVRETAFLERGSGTEEERARTQARVLGWHIRSGARNHHNFTAMACYTIKDSDISGAPKILDYGGGGGQFALIAKSLCPRAEISIVDMDNNNLLDQFRPLNKQIKFEDFEKSDESFDIIFMNDVFEHVTDPVGVLSQLRSKLNPGGRIFIDTPCQFWLYPVTKLFSKKIHTQLLKGTVDFDHQQIWTQKSFEHVVKAAGMRVVKFTRLSEYTQPASFYLNNMGVTNPLVRLAGTVFVVLSPYIARNKIMSVIDCGPDMAKATA